MKNKSKIFSWSWVKEHVRPHFKYHTYRGEEIDFKEDNIKDIIDKAEDKVEVGIKFKFKF